MWYVRATLLLVLQSINPEGNFAGVDLESDKDRPGRDSMWLSRAEIMKLPTEGEAWNQLRKTAYSEWGKADLSDQNHDHNTNVLAGALVAVRTKDEKLAKKVRVQIRSIPETENGGTTLALSRNLLAYVIAAGLVGLDDPEFDRWLREVRHEKLKGKTLISTHEVRPNNWGTHAGASRIAVAIYLGDRADLGRSARVFQGWLGDRKTYAGFKYGDLSWQADSKLPVGINPKGAVKKGRNIDGVIPDDMRRGGAFRWPPGKTGYPWAALNGVVIQAELLHRQGYDAWSWSDQAIRRAVAFLERIGWDVKGEDEEWLVHLVNARYGTRFRVPTVARVGKNFGWTDWTHLSSVK